MKYTLMLLTLVFSRHYCYEDSEESDSKEDLTSLHKDCLLPINFGHCTTSVTRYAYMVDINACVLFVYGGCGGNNNNFRTLEECENTCHFLKSDNYSESEDFFK